MQKLKQLRRKAKMNQTEVGNIVNLSQITISQIETGVIFPREVSRKKIEKLFDQKIDWVKMRVGYIESNAANEKHIVSLVEYLTNANEEEQSIRIQLVKSIINKLTP